MATNPLKVRFDDQNMDFLEARAARTGKDVTKTVNRVIEEYRNTITLDAFTDAINMPKILRLKTSSTTAEVTRITNLLTSRELNHLVFAAKICANNGRTLSGYAEFSNFVVLFDGCSINHARDPRIMEVERLLKRTASSNLNGRVSIINEPVEPTREKSPEETWEYYKELPTTPFSIEQFLKMIAPNQSHTNMLNYMPDDGFCVKVNRVVEYGNHELVGMVCFKDRELAEARYTRFIEGAEQNEGKSERFIVSITAYGRLPDQYQEVSCSPEYAASIP